MTNDSDSQGLWKRYVSRRAALRAGILGAAIPGILYVAKSAASADAADGDIYIPGAPNFLELGYGWPGKDANAGKISYRKWSDGLDIVGAGTTSGHRKVKIWDDLYVPGLLNLRAYPADPAVAPTWTAFLYAKSINGQTTKPFWKDATGTAQPLVSRSATLVVAASDASPRSKLGADYVCDGTADEVEINAAIASLPSRGGKVMLSEGKFTIAAPVLIQDKCVHLQGQGPGWANADSEDFDVGATVITAAQAYDNDFITIRSSDGAQANIRKVGGSCVSDLKIYQNFPRTSTSAHGIHVYGDVGTTWCMTIFIHRVVVSGVGGIGFYARGSDIFISQCEARGCYSAGFWMRADSVMSHVIAGGNGRSGTVEQIYLKGFCAADNIYVYGGERGGIALEGGALARGCALTNFFIDAPGHMGLWVYQMEEVTISNGFIRGGGTHQHGEDSQQAVVIDESNHVTLSGVHVYNVTGDVAAKQMTGFDLRKSNDVTLNGCSANLSLRRSVRLRGSEYCVISDCHFTDSGQETDNTYSDISLETQDGIPSTYNRVHGCNFRNTTVVRTKYGIQEADADQDHNIYHDNYFDGNQRTKAIYVAGANSRAYRNKGYVTESNGTATVPNGSTYVEVTHGLSATPNAKDISVTPTNGLGNASKFWISDVGVSTFRINVNTSPGATTATFAWHAEML